MTTFSSSANYESIKSKCNEINKIQSDFMIRKKFCAFICRADYFGDRGFFADQISKIATINFPGTFRHNDDDKKMLYNDNKLDYLRQFKFNLCPENSNNEGYVTEKIFDALTAGCIPIYWGANNQPEPNIINKNAVFFLNLNQDNEKVLSEIEKVNNSPKLYNEFMNQPKLNSDAPDIIFQYFLNLESKLKQIVTR